MKGMGHLSYGVHEILSLDLIHQVSFPHSPEPPCENPQAPEVAGKDIKDAVGIPLNGTVTQDDHATNVVLLVTTSSFHIEAGNRLLDNPGVRFLAERFTLNILLRSLRSRSVHRDGKRIRVRTGLLWNGGFLGIG